MDRDAWQKLAEESADRAEAAGAFVADRLGADYHDDYFATAKLTLWVYKQSQEIDALRAERDAALRGQARLREALKAAEWGDLSGDGWGGIVARCPVCDGVKPPVVGVAQARHGHRPDCLIAAALTATPTDE